MKRISSVWTWMVIGCLVLMPVIGIFAQGNLNKGGPDQKEIMDLEVVIDEDFELNWPKYPWTRLIDQGNYGWGRHETQAHSGSNSIWCASKRINDAPKLNPISNGYGAAMDTWAIIGEEDGIDLRNCTSGKLTFWIWVKIAWGDHFYVYADFGAGWKGIEYKGQIGGWEEKTLDLANWPGHGNLLGHNKVRFAFYFKSNASDNAEGVYVDDVMLTKYFTGWPDLVISNMSFSPQTQDLGEEITVSGTITNTETSASTNCQTKIYLSKDQTISGDEDIFLGVADIPTLDGGESSSFGKKIFIPVSLPVESFYIGGIVDPDNGIPEENDDNNSYTISTMLTPREPEGWVDIFRDNFDEVAYPGAWNLYVNNGSYMWGKEANNVIGYEGTNSIWCAGRHTVGASSIFPAGGYANGMSGWSEYGPFDLTDVEKADLSFYIWTRQNTGDKTEVLANFGTGWEYTDYLGNTGDWLYQQLDFTNWPGHGNLSGQKYVNIAFHFYSNAAGNAEGTYVDNVVIRKKPVSSAVQGNPQRPETFSLGQNTPNPFNPATTISYTLPKAADVRLTVYNIFGQEVCTLVDENVSAGRQTVTWDGADHRGNQVSSGVYFYRLKAGKFTAMKKMILVE